MCRIQPHAPYPTSDVVLDLRWDNEIVRFVDGRVNNRSNPSPKVRASPR
jgi:hypothetical protein